MISLYELFEKKSFRIDSDDFKNLSPTTFITTIDGSDRVASILKKVNAAKKYHIVLPEYDLDEADCDFADISTRVDSIIDNESKQIAKIYGQIFEEIDLFDLCIDITGFPAPQLAVLFGMLAHKCIEKVSVLYTEPMKYVLNENTEFTTGTIKEIRNIKGFNATPTTSNNDYLIIGCGYDSTRMKAVTDYKEKAKRIDLLGFPPLRPDMYQENALRRHQAFKDIEGHGQIFAPANDPFVTALNLKNFCEEIKNLDNDANIYLAPLSTKPHTLGFVLFYIAEGMDEKNCSIIFPFAERYKKKTSDGINLIWKYEINLNALKQNGK